MYAKLAGIVSVFRSVRDYERSAYCEAIVISLIVVLKVGQNIRSFDKEFS